MAGRVPGVIFFVLAGATLASVGASAHAAAGDLTYQGCQTAEVESGPVLGGTGACAPFTGSFFAGTTPGGVNSAFENLESIAVSPEGNSAYVAAGEDDALVRLNRDPGTGAVDFQYCFTGDSATPCDTVPHTAAGGANSGLDDPESVTVSPDGISVYLTTRNDDSIFRFNRDPANGFITPAGCITGETESGPMPAGSGACTRAPGATAGGDNSGFDDLKTKTVAISPDGRSLYAASERDDSVLRFNRSLANGALTYAGCVTGETESAAACTPLPSAAPGGTNSGLDQPRWLEISDDGTSLYLGTELDDSVVHFSRDAATGALAYAGCIAGETESGPGGSGACTAIPTAAPGGVNSGLDQPRALDLSPDGRSAYLAAANDAALARFKRDAATGALSYKGCLTAELASTPPPTGSGACAVAGTPAPMAANTGFDAIRGLEVSADGLSVYANGQSDSAVVSFDRNPANGALAYAGCITGEIESGPAPAGSGACAAIPSATAGGDNSGLYEAESFALSPDAHSLHVAAERDHGIASFARELDTDPPQTRIRKGPKRRSEKRRAKFKFKSDEPGSEFECSLDGEAFEPCESPLRTKKLKRRKHKFRVRATDSVGNVDPTPAKRRWKVLDD